MTPVRLRSAQAGRHLATHRAIAHAFNGHDVAALLSHYTEDVRYEDFGSGTVCTSRGELGRSAAAWFAALPDLGIEMHAVYDLGDATVGEWTLRGTARGPLPFAPGAARADGAFAVPGICVFEYASDGRVRRERDYWNPAAALARLGVLPG